MLMLVPWMINLVVWMLPNVPTELTRDAACTTMYMATMRGRRLRSAWLR